VPNNPAVRDSHSRVGAELKRLEVCTWKVVEDMVVELRILPLPMDPNKVVVAVLMDLPYPKEFLTPDPGKTNTTQRSVSKDFSPL